MVLLVDPPCTFGFLRAAPATSQSRPSSTQFLNSSRMISNAFYQTLLRSSQATRVRLLLYRISLAAWPLSTACQKVQRPLAYKLEPQTFKNFTDMIERRNIFQGSFSSVPYNSLAKVSNSTSVRKLVCILDCLSYSRRNFHKYPTLS